MFVLEVGDLFENEVMHSHFDDSRQSVSNLHKGSQCNNVFPVLLPKRGTSGRPRCKTLLSRLRGAFPHKRHPLAFSQCSTAQFLLERVSCRAKQAAAPLLNRTADFLKEGRTEENQLEDPNAVNETTLGRLWR